MPSSPKKKKIKIKKDSYSYYPELNNSNFYEKIYKKKEFHKHRIIKKKKSAAEVCNPLEFNLLPQQKFLRNFISDETPYNGMLIFHGVGTGKTCTAITIAEQFKSKVKHYQKKILVILSKNIISNFKKQIYDLAKEERKKRKDDIVQCTGNEYSLPEEESKYLTRDQRIRKVDKKINSFYQFMGYEKFANDVLRNVEWDGNPDTLEENTTIQQRISNYYSNRVIIIDEVQHVKSISNIQKKVPPILEAIIRYSKNIKLIMLSATPMHDKPEEIIYLLNLLLLNDGRPTIPINAVFNSQGNLKPEGVLILKHASRGYISYLRGQNPLTFPIRLFPKNAKVPANIEYDMNGNQIADDEKIRYLRIAECSFDKYQETQYKALKTGVENVDVNDVVVTELAEYEEEAGEENNKIGMSKNLLWISNIVYPMKNGRGTYGKLGISAHDDGKGALYRHVRIIDNRKFLTFKYQSHVIADKGTKQETPFLDQKVLGKYSTKFSEILGNILSAQGIIFVYSTYLSGGVIPFSLMLEQNGILRYEMEGERQLLEYPANNVGGGGKRLPICYLCSQHASAAIHKHGHKKYHRFQAARYILLTGDRDITRLETSRAIEKAVEIVNSKSNEYGKEVKIIVGNKVVAEGIDFKRIRQVHIVEPWYNLQTLEQIIGRADRNCSHIDLPEAERNVEIFFYAAVYGKGSEYETIDLHNYRISELKDVKIKKVERILKESAVDCMLNKEENVYPETGKFVRLITASGNKIPYKVGDKPYSRICDYMASCNYKCDWDGKVGDKLNTNTYSIKFAESDINTIIKNIVKIFAKQYVYNLEKITAHIESLGLDIEKDYIYLALNKMIGERVPVYDKYGREGYIIYRGGLYIFQPRELDDIGIPLYYRTKPLTVKPREVPIEYHTMNVEEQNEPNEHVDLEKEVNKYVDELEDVVSDNDIGESEALRIVLAMILDRMRDIEPIMRNLFASREYTKIDKYVAQHLRPYILERDGKIYGYRWDGEAFCWKDGVFKKCDVNIQRKLETELKLKKLTAKKEEEKKFAEVYGMLDHGKREDVKFFIVNAKQYLYTLTISARKSKRSEITGRVCDTFKFDVLEQVGKDIKMKLRTGRIKKGRYCLALEFFLRYKQMNDATGKVWFINKIEH